MSPLPLVGHWRLDHDGRDVSGHSRHATPHGPVGFGSGGAASFGRRGCLTVPGSALAELDGGSFTVSAWLRLPDRPADVIGDVVSMFDPTRRRGFGLGVQHGVSTSSHHNTANLEFGVDDATAPRWADTGRLGDSIAVWAMAVAGGRLYAGTLGGPSDHRGHVWSFDGDGWTDLGPVGEANSVSALAVVDGALHAGTTRYRGGGSGLDESPNQAPGAEVLRLDPAGGWTPCGRLPDADSISGFAVHRGQLYATALYQRGTYRYDGDGRWASCGDPGRRLLALGVFDGAVFGAGNDHVNVDEALVLTSRGEVVPAEQADGGGGVFRLGDAGWESWGLQPDTTQVYSLAAHRDDLVASTWPHGLVFRHDGGQTWRSLGRLADETEVMGLVTYNGKLYGGTLPHALLCRFDGPDDWPCVGTLDVTPDVPYRRTAALAAYRGSLFCGTLPSGRVHAMTAGTVATDDDALGPGWHHVVATRVPGESRLYVDGRLVGTGLDTEPEGAFARPDADLVIGSGPRGRFAGELAEVAIFAAGAAEVDVRDLFAAGARTGGATRSAASW